MSAYEIAETYIKQCNNFDFSVINFANGDMV
jgi:bisphosphoglycerate-independent phosphoglycerate mutase (AlkP superfamily)